MKHIDPKVKAASLSILSNSVLVVLKLIVGLLSGSVSIISEAAHSALDLFAAIIAFLSVRASGRPADKEHPYGHGKIENISGVVEAALIFIAAAWIIYEAIHKLLKPTAIDTVTFGIVVMGISVLANTLIARYLFRVAKATDSIALEADAQHLSTDVWTSLGVFGGLIFIKITGWDLMDPIVALGVAVLIIRVSIELTWKAAAPLLDVGLPEVEVQELVEIVMKTPKVVGYHKLRTRKSGPYRQIDYHLIVPASLPLYEAHDIAECIEDKMRERFRNMQVITHVEPDTPDTVNEPDTEMKRRPPVRKTRHSPRLRRRSIPQGNNHNGAGSNGNSEE